MKKLVRIVIAAALPLSVVLVSSPARAAGAYAKKDGVWNYFNASPEPVKKCGKVQLHGEVWDQDESFTDGDHSIFFAAIYFRKSGTSKWVYKGGKNAAYNGRYTLYMKQCHSGTWKSSIGVEDWFGPSVSDAVKVR
jgi:hypothetical protein